MDHNLVVLSGRLAAPIELRTFDDGPRLARCLITVRSSVPKRRVDVVPVALWDPTETLVDRALAPGTRVWAVGSIQRRFWTANSGRRSRLEVVADEIRVHDGGVKPGEYSLADA